MKNIIFFLMLLASPSVFSAQIVALSPISFQISADDALSKFEQTLLYPENLLKRYKPSGAKISDKRVSQNVISFTATKTILFISKSVYVNGILDSIEDNKACQKNEVGHELRMHFESSDHLLTDNVEELQATVCLKSISSSKLSGIAHSKIIIGNNYSKTLGPIAIDLIKEQVLPLMEALTEEIKSMR